MSVVLQTVEDATREDRVMERMSGGTYQHFRLPAMSLVDYLLIRDGQIKYLVEVKVRKEPMHQVRSYGGLMLKHRKVSELDSLSSMLQVPTVILFAFDNGEGAVLVTQPHLLLNHRPEAPPVRRRYRGLACDEEPVIYLDWDRDLKVAL